MVWFGLVWFSVTIGRDTKSLIYKFALDDSNENKISSWEHTALGFSFEKAPSNHPLVIQKFIFTEDMGAGNAAENC